MIIGCFAMIEPFTPMERQFQAIAEMEAKRGEMFGCGMAVIPLGDGVIDMPPIISALGEIGFEGGTTLEVAGPDNVRKSVERLNECGWVSEPRLERLPGKCEMKLRVWRLMPKMPQQDEF